MSQDIVEQIKLLREDMMREFELSRSKTVAEIKDYVAKEVDAKITKLESRIKDQERELRKRNLVIFGLEETENEQLDMKICTFFLQKMDLGFQSSDIDFVRRMGKRVESRRRPIILGFVTLNSKLKVLKKVHMLKGVEVSISQDYPKEVINTRKLLHPQMMEARKAGKYAIIKYDKLIIKESNNNAVNRKRMMSASPQQQDHPVSQPTKTYKKNKGENSVAKKQGTLDKYSVSRVEQVEKTASESETSARRETP